MLWRDHMRPWRNDIPKAKDVWSFKDIIHPCHFSPVPTESRKVQPNQPVIPFPPNRRNCRNCACGLYLGGGPGSASHPTHSLGKLKESMVMISSISVAGIHRFRNTTNLTNKSDWTNICNTCLYMYSVEILWSKPFFGESRPAVKDEQVFPPLAKWKKLFVLILGEMMPFNGYICDICQGWNHQLL